MPTPDKTSVDAIVRAAGDILEDAGLSALTMKAVALRVGVRPPSLYKRVENRDGLIRLLAESTLTELADRLDSAPTPIALANGFRAFGHERPVAFQLVMTPGAGVPTARAEYGAAASAAILRFTGGTSGSEHALDAARTLTAWAVGFVSMELTGGFLLDGDVDAAWRFGVTRMLETVASSTGQSLQPGS